MTAAGETIYQVAMGWRFFVEEQQLRILRQGVANLAYICCQH
jgi:hypothetical protein